MRFQLETLREGIVQSLSVLGQLKGGIIFVFWRDRRFTDSKNYSYLPRYLSKKLALFAGVEPKQFVPVSLYPLTWKNNPTC